MTSRGFRRTIPLTSCSEHKSMNNLSVYVRRSGYSKEEFTRQPIFGPGVEFVTVPKHYQWASGHQPIVATVLMNMNINKGKDKEQGHENEHGLEQKKQRHRLEHKHSHRHRHCSVSRWRPQKVDKRMVLEYTHGVFIT
jgi:hypothetical protein